MVRWDPLRDLEEMSDRLNRVFGGSSRSGSARSLQGGERETLAIPDWSPRVDIAETDEEFQIKAEIPEVSKEDVKVSIENGVLSIRGERKQEKEESGKRFHRVERYYGSFLRTFTVPDNIDEGKVRAEFKDGVLNILLPKSEKAKPKAIDVKVG
jgi:HSP20 family protein